MPKRIRSHHAIQHSPQARKDLKEFGAEVKRRRLALGLSRAKLIEKIGVKFSIPQLWNIETAKNWPSGPLIYRLCRTLGMRIPQNKA